MSKTEIDFDPEILKSSTWSLLKVPPKYREKIRQAFNKAVTSDMLAACVVPKQLVLTLGSAKPKSVILYPDYIVFIGEYTSEVQNIFEVIFRQFRLRLPTLIPLALQEITELKKYLHSGTDQAVAMPKLDFNVNDVVEIRFGPLCGFKGRVDNINWTKETAKLKVSIFGRETVAEVGFHDLIASAS